MSEQDQGVPPSGPGSQASPEAASASSPSVSIPNAVPREMDDEGAVQWTYRRMSSRQKAALSGFPTPDVRWLSSEIGATGATLASLGDFERGRRGIMAPLMLVTREYDEFARAYRYGLSDFGVRVLGFAQAIEARRAATAKTGAVEDESAVPKGCAQDAQGNQP